MKIIAFVHHKGGTGKTTACLNIAGCLAKQDKKVLVVDMDPQGSATSGLGLKPNQEPSIYQVLMGDIPIHHAIFETQSNIYLLPSTVDLFMIESRLSQSTDQAHLLRKNLVKIAHHFDVILIDAPGGHTSLLINTIIAATGHLIVPLDSGVFAYESLETFHIFLAELATAYQVPIEIIAVLLRGELRFSSQMAPTAKNGLKKIISSFWEKNPVPTCHYLPKSDIAAFWKTKGIEDVTIYQIPHSDDIIRSQIAGIPVSHYAPDSEISQIYQKITTDLIK
jgi:chromosome partitioning protein